MYVAVIMSVYVKELPELFARAVESILAQEVDDGTGVRLYLGVDGPVGPELDRMIKRYEGRIYKTIRFEKNRGLAPVLNDLIEALEDEEFVFRMDTDDVSHSNRFQRQLKFLAEHPHVDILGTSIVEVVEGLDSRRVVHFSPKSGRSARRYIARGVPVAHPTVCFRRSVFRKIAGYPIVRNNEDIALWFLCLRNGFTFENLREPLYEFTVSQDFLGRRGFDKAFTEFIVYSKGIWLLHGLTVDYFFPLARFGLRLLPRFVQEFAYGSKLRPREILNEVL